MATRVARPRRVWAAMAGIMLAYFIYPAQNWMVPVALPRTVADLNGMALFSWAISANALATALAGMVLGKLSDLYGRRSILTISLALVVLGSGLCALSQDMPQFLVSRAVQGLGVGAIVVLCFSVLADLFPPAERGKWATLLNLATAAGVLVGPVLAGIITDTIGWRYVFWFFVPYAVVAAIIVWFSVPTAVTRSAHKTDYLGVMLLLLASTAMLLAFSWAGSRYAWDSPQIVGVLGGSIVLWGFFLRVESTVPEPLLAPSVLTNRIFLTVSVATTLSQVGLQAVFLYLPLFLQAVQERSATVAGQLMTPLTLMTALMNVASGLMLARFKRYRWILTISYVVMTAALLWLNRFDGNTSTPIVIVASGLFGLGFGLQPTINTLVVQNAAPKRMLGQVTGANYFFVQIGGTMAPAILGSSMNSAYVQALPGRLPEAVTRAVDGNALAALNDPGILLSRHAMETVQAAFVSTGSGGLVLLQQTMLAVRDSLEGAIGGLFMLGAIVMVAATLLIVTIPEVPLAGRSSESIVEAETV